MKVNFHYHFYSRIFISLLIFAFGFFLLQKSVDTRALIPNEYQNDTPIVGWAWNDKIGWIALNCANDLDGDGVPEGGRYSSGSYWGSCADYDAGLGWGLKMTEKSVDHDNVPATPNVDLNYVEGCAWAGGGVSASSTPSWICFSDPGGTLAPSNGVLMSNESVNVNYCSCSINKGTCEAGSINTGECSNYRYCTGISSPYDNICIQSTHRCSLTGDDCASVPCPQQGNRCVAGTCSISGGACTTDDNCQFACQDDTNPYSLLKGVCFDGSPAQETILRNGRGLNPPLDSLTLPPCYINNDCASGSKCVYPQAGLPATGLGYGECTNSFGEITGFDTCAYDFDCPSNFPTCNLQVPASWLNPPSCGASCVGAYEENNSSLSLNHYANALNPIAFDEEGFASILKIEPVTGISTYNNANQISFPILFRINDNASLNSVEQDRDNPNLASNDNNPLRGCFNCYTERIYKCASGGSCVCNQGNISCVDTSNCNSAEDLCSVDKLEHRCENCQEYFYYSGKCGMNGSGSGTPCENDNACSVVGETCELSNTCRLQPDSTCTTNSNCSMGDSCVQHELGDLKKVLSGFNCTDCIIENPANSCTLNPSGINNNRCSTCQISSTESSLYRAGGVVYDNQHGRSSTSTLCGWGYNAWEDSTDPDGQGLGWFNFSPLISTSTKPYFSVEKGNIYSKGRIATRYQPPISKYNASYLIESSGDIINFVSQASKDEKFQGELAERPVIDYFNPIINNTKFKNALGKLDYSGLITTAKTISGENYNKYGSVIETVQLIPPEVYANNDIFDEAFNNKVIHVTNVPPNGGYGVEFGNGASLEVKCGNSSDPSGAGIIVVEGSMKIKHNITYEESCTFNNLKQIPSLVWIVKGDVTIDSRVTKVAGTFIILGDGNNNCSGAVSAPACGQFRSVHFGSTGEPTTPGAEFLEVAGNVLARKFILLRTKVDALTGTASERFINDGRLQSNPPLGLTDMSRVIPRFSSY